jgi:hypothetical protein
MVIHNKILNKWMKIFVLGFILLQINFIYFGLNDFQLGNEFLLDFKFNTKVSEMPNSSFSIIICKFNQSSNFVSINATIEAHNCITKDCLMLNESGKFHRYYLLNLTNALPGEINSLFSNSTITSCMLGWENISYYQIPPIGTDIDPIYYNESQINTNLNQPIKESIEKTLRQTEDPLLSEQWGYYMVQAGQAYAENITGENIVIGVIDSGVQVDHDDLDDNYLGGYDFVNSDPIPDDQNGHGTHVAGIICAEANSIGIRGVAPDAKFYAYKVLNENGSGTNFDLAKGIKRAVSDGVDIITMSLGGFASPIVEAAVNEAYVNNIIQVAAAGNEDNNDPVYPAAYPEVLSIGAIASDKEIASYSNFGTWIDFVGPGGEPPFARNLILSTYYESNYVYLAGTSMACPFISGIIALIIYNLTHAPNGTPLPVIITPNLIKNELISSSQDLGIIGTDIYYGYGLPIWGELLITTTPIPNSWIFLPIAKLR